MDEPVLGHGRAPAAPGFGGNPPSGVVGTFAKAPGWDGGGKHPPPRAPGCSSQAAHGDGAVGARLGAPSPNPSPQCHPALDGQRGKCWCVDRKTGVKLPGFLELKGDLDCHQLADSM